jgi:hypothetical protein
MTGQITETQLGASLVARMVYTLQPAGVRLLPGGTPLSEEPPMFLWGLPDAHLQRDSTSVTLRMPKQGYDLAMAQPYLSGRFRPALEVRIP